VFQGSYKAVVINGEATDGSYFKIVADRLGMGHEVSVTRAVRRYREDKEAAGRLAALAAKLGI
jgi:hypothetical protein